MSVIVAKTANCPTTSQPTQTSQCFVAVRASKIVSVGMSDTVDSVLITDYCAVKWIVTMSNQTGTHIRSFEVFATYEAATPCFVQYSIIGYKFTHHVDVLLVSGALQLNITNNDGEDFYVYSTRIAVPVSKSVQIPTSTINTVVNRNHAAPATTVAIDFFDDVVVGVKWVINIQSSTGEKTVMQLASSSAFINCYSITGDTPQYDLALNQIPGFGTELTITNNSSSHIKITATRIPIAVADIDMQSCIGSNAAPLWIPTAMTVPSSSTIIVDTVTVPNHTVAKWLVVLTQPAIQKTCALELLSNIASTTTTDVLYGRISSFIAADLQTTVNAGVASLSCTNNSSDGVRVNLLRIPVGL